MESSGAFSIKELLQEMVLPRLTSNENRLREIEVLAREGTPYQKEKFKSIESEIQDLRQQIDHVRQALLTPDGVAKLIGEAMQNSEARGWTQKERWMGVGIFLFTAANLLVLFLK